MYRVRQVCLAPTTLYKPRSRQSGGAECARTTIFKGGSPSAIAQLTIDNQLFGECYASEGARKTEGDGSPSKVEVMSFSIPSATRLRRVVNMARTCCFREARMPRWHRA
ncbi:unnamed protein product [Cercospora beticola]|nr:unnamed protein product [Cercospora beticola]